MNKILKILKKHTNKCIVIKCSRCHIKKEQENIKDGNFKVLGYQVGAL